MKKIVKNAIFIVILIVIAMSIFNISYAMLSTGNFSKLSTVKNTTVLQKITMLNIQIYKVTKLKIKTTIIQHIIKQLK